MTRWPISLCEAESHLAASSGVTAVSSSSSSSSSGSIAKAKKVSQEYHDKLCAAVLLSLA